MGLPRRVITCPGCGATGRHYSRGLCRGCYLAEPDQRARNRWRLMVLRCTDPGNPAWSDYGGRGIKVCERWLQSFDAYYQDVGDAPDGMSLDRIDNDGDYEPANVRWATQSEQVRNQRHHQASKTECPQQHPYDAANTRHTPTGKRECRACGREKQRRFVQRTNQKVSN